ncbi:TPA: WYL domain-containing protein [Pseudomonas putida]|uniref:helix-turn-helix transcriptional regulator n=1 Tax=Pseudomonas putida TaxID=303 RepID=UPI002363CC4E|nr:WYL domain-containing protein [Pseudomonas putida]MDD2151861.1 WYL domain-containing protein [Pseudomonas putida]HDS1680171.1 WYL domain-containing protein [Pseudomonas putida]
MTTNALSQLTQAQRDRLAYLELRLRFVGEIGRHDLIRRFGIQTAAATRDFAAYRELAGNNLAYDRSSKIYTPTKDFRPVFGFSAKQVLAWLAEGFGDGEPVTSAPGIACVTPDRLTQPDLDTLGVVTRAIYHRCPLKIEYYSIGSGKTQREIVPFALIDTGLRWHVRGYDRKRCAFRDFVITRIRRPKLLIESPVAEQERPEQDVQWSRIIEVELVPHPDQSYPEITEMDYGLNNGVLRLRLRGATVGYVLRKWSIDCSPDHRLRGPEYRLWLKDPLLLYGVETAVLAPGYLMPMENRKQGKK